MRFYILTVAQNNPTDKPFRREVVDEWQESADRMDRFIKGVANQK